MEILDRKARVALAATEGMKSQEGFETVVDEAATLRAHKVIQHGEDRYREGEEMINLVETLTMVRKKGQRVNRVLDQIIMKGMGVDEDSPSLSLDPLRDTLLDGANYNMMGVQLLDQLMGRKPIWVSETAPFPVKVETAANIFLPFEQVAIQVEDIDETISFLALLGLTEWSHDEVRAAGYVSGKKESNVAHLAFNYQAGPFELELIHYEAGPNWLEDRYGQKAGLSHLGIHVSDMDFTYDTIRDRLGDLAIAQEVITETHSNLKVPKERQYWYVILATRHLFGFDLKMIQRLTRHTVPPVMLCDRIGFER